MKLISRLVNPLLLSLALFSGVTSAEMHEGQSIEGMQVHSAWVRAAPLLQDVRRLHGAAQ